MEAAAWLACLPACLLACLPAWQADRWLFYEPATLSMKRPVTCVSQLTLMLIFSTNACHEPAWSTVGMYSATHAHSLVTNVNEINHHYWLQAAQDLFQTAWESMIGTPSKNTASPEEQVLAQLSFACKVCVLTYGHAHEHKLDRFQCTMDHACCHCSASLEC